MKVLLYSTKAKPYLYQSSYNLYYYLKNYKMEAIEPELRPQLLNGKVCAMFEWGGYEKIHNFVGKYEISLKQLNGSCLTYEELYNYGKGKDLYAWHIKNLNVFDVAVELNELYSYNKLLKVKNYKDKDLNDTIERLRKLGSLDYYRVKKAPQSYQYVYYKGEKYLLLPIKSEWVYKILNGEKTSEIRKSVPKEVR